MLVTDEWGLTPSNTVDSPNFLLSKFCGKTQFPHSFRRFAQDYAETVPFHKSWWLGNLESSLVLQALFFGLWDVWLLSVKKVVFLRKNTSLMFLRFPWRVSGLGEALSRTSKTFQFSTSTLWSKAVRTWIMDCWVSSMLFCSGNIVYQKH